MSLTVVTSFGPGGWELYGERFYESFIKYWPKDVQLQMWYHDCPLPTVQPPANITFHFLNEDKDLIEFKKAHGNMTGHTQQGYDFRIDAVKFSHKVFAICNAAERTKEGYLLWLDCDTFTTAPIDLTELLKDDPQLDYLGREGIYAETSYLLFNLSNSAVATLIKDLVNLYTTGELFAYREWHDGFAFERLVRLHKEHGLPARSLTSGVTDLDAFHKAPIGKYMTHMKGNKKHEKTAAGLIPLRVKPQDCVDDTFMVGNIKSNTAKFTRWMKLCWPHDRRAVIVAAGPSLQENLEAIRTLQSEGAYIMCVKHSYPILRAANIIPDGCLILDPRPFEENSTHGQKRSTLLDKADGNTLFYVASMTNPAYLPFLEARGAKIIGWHAMSNAIVTAGLKMDLAVAGGTCSAIRAFAVLHLMGFRRFTVFGVDASVKNAPDLFELMRKDDGGRPWWMEVSSDPEGKNRYWSTGELVALVQDVEALAKQSGGLDSQIDFISPLLAGDIWRKIGPQIPPRSEFKELINE